MRCLISSPLNEGARIALQETGNKDWLAVLKQLLGEHWDGEAHPFNPLEPRLKSLKTELIPPACFAQLLRRAFAPDLFVSDPMRWEPRWWKSQAGFECLQLWQDRVIEPLGALLGTPDYA